MLDRWIKAHRIGLAAYRLSLPRTASQAGAVEEAGISPLLRANTFLSDELQTGIESWPYFIESLPPLVLHLLTSIPHGNLRRDLASSRISWRRTLKTLVEVDENDVNGIPLVSAGRISAHHILHGVGKPISVLRLIKALFGRGWTYIERDTGVRDAMDAGLPILRSPWSNTAARLKAVQDIGGALESTASRAGRVKHVLPWRHIENALYHQLFCWPLLVFSGASGSVGAISFPVGIDVYLDGRARVIGEGNGDIKISEWDQLFRDIAEAAKVQWRGKHGNYGPLRDEIREASVVFDFGTAAEIAAGFPADITLSKNSMEAYFSQVILSRFLGNTVSSSSVITGSLGKRRWNELGGYADYELEWPGEVTKKLKYVFQSQFFERVILPNLDLRDSRRRNLDKFVAKFKSEQSTEINFVTHLQHAADAFQVGGWRQSRYVRCPDIGWRIHPSGARLPSLESDEVQACLKTLRENVSTVWELPANLGVINLAAALWHINMTLRNRIEYDRPPMMSWAFVRATADEQDTRFWHVVWKQLGASADNFEEFHQTSTPAAAAGKLAEALNVFFPSQASPGHRAPDILVLVGTDRLSATLEKARNPLLRCHAFGPVVEFLGRDGVLEPNFFPAMRELIGQTRIIVIRSDEPLEKEQPQDMVEPEYKPLLQALQVFRFGFSQQIASLLWRMLGYESAPVRDVLEHFRELDVLRYGPAEYHVPGKIGISRAPLDNPMEIATAHFAAGMAMAPYLSLSNLPAIAFDRAFNPEIVHEAHFHLKESYRAIEKKERDSFRETVVTALQRLQRFGEYPGWHTVINLHKTASKDAYEIAMELIEAREATGTPPHPVQLLTAIDSVEQRWNQLRADPQFTNQDEVAELNRKIEDLFGQAVRACECAEWRSERDYNRLFVITQRCLFLQKYQSAFWAGYDVSAQIAALTKEAWELLASGVDGTAIRGEWHEIAGDTARDHAEAERAYGFGVRWKPEWRQLWIKQVGCLVLDGNRAKATKVIDSIPDKSLEPILKSSIAGLRRDRKQTTRPWVKLRWKSGIAEFESRFGRDPYLHGMLSLYVRELAQWREGAPAVEGD
jgi:hypothetical protein